MNKWLKIEILMMVTGLLFVIVGIWWWALVGLNEQIVTAVAITALVLVGSGAIACLFTSY